MPQAEGAVAPPRTLAPEAEGGEADEAAPALAQADARRDFTKLPMARPDDPFAGRKAEPNRRRPRESPRGSSQGNGEGLRPQPRPERGSSKRLRPSRRAPGERQGLRAAPRSEKGFQRASASRHSSEGGKASARASFERATGEVSASMRTRGDGAASAGPDPPREARARISVPARATRRGSVRGLRASPVTHRGPNGASRPRSGSWRRATRPLCPRRDPKPPSERWPRHPATAVKAGTSGGRWRHRPPL